VDPQAQGANQVGPRTIQDTLGWQACMTDRAHTRRRALLAALVAATITVALAVPSRSAVLRTPVRAKRGIGEFQPAHSGAYFAWERNTKAQPGHYDVYAQRSGGQRFKINAKKSNGALGGIDGTLLTYQQYFGDNSDIKLYNLVSRRRFEPRTYVNTKLWEYWPSISGEWLLFGRRNLAGDKRWVILFNRRSKRVRVLDVTTSTNTFLGPGQITGNWAVWHRCKPPTKCDVFRYDIQRGVSRKIPNPSDRSQYAASVTAEGNVFFARGSRQCGKRVKLMRYRKGRTPRPLLRLGRGRDIGDTYASTTSSGDVQIFFEQNQCRRVRTGTDIFRLRFI
jgi:hypothetical protein